MRMVKRTDHALTTAAATIPLRTLVAILAVMDQATRVATIGIRRRMIIMANTNEQRLSIKSLRGVVRTAIWLLFALFIAAGQTAHHQKSDAEIKQAIIADSIAQYRGSCPCPYSTDRAGHRCGRRSAYSRRGGASPVCYPEDVTPQMVAEYRRNENH